MTLAELTKDLYELPDFDPFTTHLRIRIPGVKKSGVYESNYLDIDSVRKFGSDIVINTQQIDL